MTDKHDNHLADAFDGLDTDGDPHDTLPDDFNLASDDDEELIKRLIAAIISDRYTLSAEDLRKFDVLLDDPDSDPEEREACLQEIGNIVMCIIDLQWDQALSKAGQKACGSLQKDDPQSPSAPHDMVQYDNNTASPEHQEAADQEPAPERTP